QGVILIVDDEPDLRAITRLSLEGAGYEVLEAESAPAVYALLRSSETPRPDVVLLDIRLGEDDGLALLSAISDRIDAAIVMVTASRQVEHAVFALKNGAFDYLSKPVARDHLLLAVRNGVERGRMQRELAARRALDDAHDDAETAVFASVSMRLVRQTLEKVRDRKVPLLILGESGTGKEVAARWVHETGRRCDGPFVAVNCAALPRELVEAELFGHEAGAFTGADRVRLGRFEEASGGTLFLDEIGELAPEIQAKLLRVLDSGTVTRLGGQTVSIDTRIIAATHRDLVADVAAGRFRQDLYYRLEVISVMLPPLRERLEEIPALADFLLERFAREESLNGRELAADALDLLVQQTWPGNIRELENVLKRSALLSDGPQIRAEHLVFSPAATFPSDRPTSDLSTSDREASAALETRRMRDMPPQLAREAMLRALAETRGNVSAAARRLGIGRSTFYRHARHLGLPT
ncbi:MAG: sigma-54 dependent transcriptional regulator, partial [Myxococcota bacterium]